MGSALASSFFSYNLIFLHVPYVLYIQAPRSHLSYSYCQYFPLNLVRSYPRPIWMWWLTLCPPVWTTIRKILKLMQMGRRLVMSSVSVCLSVSVSESVYLFVFLFICLWMYVCMYVCMCVYFSALGVLNMIQYTWAVKPNVFAYAYPNKCSLSYSFSYRNHANISSLIFMSLFISHLLFIFLAFDPSDLSFLLYLSHLSTFHSIYLFLCIYLLHTPSFFRW